MSRHQPFAHEFFFRYNENHDPDNGQFTSGDGGSSGGSVAPTGASIETKSKAQTKAAGSGNAASSDRTSASSLFEQYNDPSVTAGGIVASVRGAALAVASADERLKEGIETTASVDKGGFMTPEHTYTPERQALHGEILATYFNPASVKAATPPAGEAPTMTVLGGRGGSGKSWFTNSGVVDKTHAIYINSDEIQEHLPGYEGWNAAFYHTEASDIAAQADDIARSLGVNVIHDATMRTTAGTAKRVKEYKADGYRIEGHYMFLPPQTSTKRGLERFVRGGKAGRYVLPSYLLGSVTNEKTFDTLRPNFDKWSIYQNMGASPQLVAEGSK